MPYFCDNLKRIEIDIRNSVLKSNINIPIKDNNNNNYRIELASVNPNYWGKSYCYIYAITFHVYNSSKYEDMGFLKIDICTGIKVVLGELPKTTSNVIIWHQKDIYLGEPIFVPNPNRFCKI